VTPPRAARLWPWGLILLVMLPLAVMYSVQMAWQILTARED
jgi:hypothetical protein